VKVKEEGEREREGEEKRIKKKEGKSTHIPLKLRLYC
jgi:hypothetical protein